jgi:hypothetical protein
MIPAPVLVPLPTPCQASEDIKEIQDLIQQAREIIRVRRSILLGTNKVPAP